MMLVTRVQLSDSNDVVAQKIMYGALRTDNADENDGLSHGRHHDPFTVNPPHQLTTTNINIKQAHVRTRERNPMRCVVYFVCFLLLSVTISSALGGSSSMNKEAITEASLGASLSNDRHVDKRGKVLTNPLDVNDMYEAYREIRANYYNKTRFSTSWKVLNVKDGVEVAILEHEEDLNCPYVRMQAVLPVPVEECWDFLRVDNWHWSMPKMDPFYEGVSVHGNFSHPAVGVLLCRKRVKRIFTFGKRDLVFLSVTENEPLADGTWVSGTVSVHVSELPRQPGYTRAFQDSVAFYKPIVGNHTALTVVCRIDLNDAGGDGGWIPMWLYVKTIGYTGAQSFLKMRNALMERKGSQKLRTNEECSDTLGL
eukprot:scaffold287_cov173-Amphora_coffeaeformis.AAC.29